MVLGLMDLEKVRTTCVFCPTLVVLFGGVTEVTVGAVVSAVAAVVKALFQPLHELPARSCTPPLTQT